MKRVRISSSISNFYQKLRARYKDYGDFRWFSKDPTIFFGMYHVGDYLRLALHRGPSTTFWCGSDILNCPSWMVRILRKSKHVCENTVEQAALKQLGLESTVHPMFFDNPKDYKTCYKPSKKPTVYMAYHMGREEEYGVWRFLALSAKVPEVNFRAYSELSKEEYNRTASKHQAVVRFNRFDGFAETLAKGVLWGQHCFSAIPYPDMHTITTDENLIEELRGLVNKPKASSHYWRKQLSNRLEI